MCLSFSAPVSPYWWAAHLEVHKQVGVLPVPLEVVFFQDGVIEAEAGEARESEGERVRERGLESEGERVGELESESE